MRIFPLLIFVFISFLSNSQCDVTITASTTVVPCGGGPVTLTANGSGFSTVLLDNDFDGGTAGPGWNVSPAGQFNNPCDPSVDGGTYMWMGSSTAAPKNPRNSWHGFILWRGTYVSYWIIQLKEAPVHVKAPI